MKIPTPGSLAFAALACLLLPHSLKADIMVSNLGQPTSGSSPLEFGFWFGNRFVTDSSAASFTLEHVVLDLGSSMNSSGNFFAAIYSDSSGQPGILLETLSGTTNPSTPGNHTFTSNALGLSANTSYWIVAGVSSGAGSYSWNLAASNSSTGPWSIPATETHIYSFNQGGLWQPAQPGFPRKFSVSAAAVPEPSIFGIAAVAPVLLFIRRRCAS